jgi:hypothetical protein
MNLVTRRWTVLHRAASLFKSCTPLFGDVALRPMPDVRNRLFRAFRVVESRQGYLSERTARADHADTDQSAHH